MGEEEGLHAYTQPKTNTALKQLHSKKIKGCAKKMPSGPELHSNVLVAGLNITLDPFRDYETALMSGTALSKNIQGEGALEGDRVPAIRVEGINTKEE